MNFSGNIQPNDDTIDIIMLVPESSHYNLRYDGNGYRVAFGHSCPAHLWNWSHYSVHAGTWNDSEKI